MAHFINQSELFSFSSVRTFQILAKTSIFINFSTSFLKFKKSLFNFGLSPKVKALISLFHFLNNFEKFKLCYQKIPISLLRKSYLYDYKAFNDFQIVNDWLSKAKVKELVILTIKWMCIFCMLKNADLTSNTIPSEFRSKKTKV